MKVLFAVRTIVPACCSVACAGVLGVEGVEYVGDDGGTGGAADAPAGDASAGDVGGDNGAAPPSGPASNFATGQQAPKDIVVDASNVYWLSLAQGSDVGAIWQLPKKPNPGPPAVFVNGADVTTPYAMTGDTATLYWSGGPRVQRHDKAGGTTTGVLWYGQSTSDGVYLGLVVQAGKLFAAGTAHGGEVFSGDTDGTSIFTLENNLGDVKSVTVDATDVYAGKTGGIVKESKGGSSHVAFATTGGAVQSITNDATTVYWVDATSVRSLDKTNIGGTPTDLATAQNTPSALALDAANVYWTTGDGLVQSVPKAGGKPQILSTDEGDPRAIAVDSAGVFWTNYADGRVRVIWR